MTYKEFQHAIAKIQREKYAGSFSTPVEFALKRADFVEAKLREMMALADKTPFSTAHRKRAAWQRELERIAASRKRFQTLRAAETQRQ